MIEGVRQSGAHKRIWRHNDTADLESLLAAEPKRPKLIVFESLAMLRQSGASAIWPRATAP
jgi:5-aminolevulinate synthase